MGRLLDLDSADIAVGHGVGRLVAVHRAGLTALVGRQLTVKPGTLRQTGPAALLADIAGQHAVVQGALDKDYVGQTVRFLFPASEAVTLSGHVMSSAAETIEERASARASPWRPPSLNPETARSSTPGKSEPPAP